MSYRNSAPLFFAGAMLLIAGVGASGVRQLQAQEAMMAPAVAQASAGPAAAEPAGSADLVPAPAVSSDAGPRMAQPVEGYQPDLPGHERSNSSAAAAQGGSHTIVLSTLALVLVVIIVVLLATH